MIKSFKPLPSLLPRLAAIAVLALALGSCGGGGGAAPAAPDPVAPGPTPAPLQLLFFGNSHTHEEDLALLVGQLLRAADPARGVSVVVDPDLMFLDDRLAHAPSRERLGAQAWSAVVLQAQRYSSSGLVEYSTEEAKAWVRLTREAGAVPVLFPEWPRRGVPETARIFALHTGIASAEPACVPPIPQAFDLATSADPTLKLHAADGNHASAAGALLAAMVIASTVDGRDPAAWPDLSPSPVPAAQQARLRQAASAAVAQVSPWALCPQDRP